MKKCLCFISGQYFLAVILLLCLSTVMTVVVLYIHHRGALEVRVPIAARKLVLEWLATAVFMRGTVKAMISQKQSGKVSEAFMCLMTSDLFIL